MRNTGRNRCNGKLFGRRLGNAVFALHCTDKQYNINDGVVAYLKTVFWPTVKLVILGDAYSISLDVTCRAKSFYVLEFYRTFQSNAEVYIDGIRKYYTSINRMKMSLLWRHKY